MSKSLLRQCTSLALAGLTGVGIAIASGEGARAMIVSVTVTKVEPFADGRSFGDVGPYERVIGVAKGELDPADKLNAGIVNLDKAPRNARGMVEYEAELFFLRPVDPAKANGKLIYEVNNRGNKYLVSQFNRVRGLGVVNDPIAAEHAGDGFLFRRGYTLAWSGWDPDVPRANKQISIKLPVATDKGAPIVRIIREEFVPGSRGQERDTFRLSYEAARLDDPGAKATVRRREADAPTAIPAGQWRFVDARTVQFTPDGMKPEQGSIYEIFYPAKNPKVMGMGFAATRDVVSFLRYETKDRDGNANPLHSMRSVMAVGISQSGRYLRDHLWQGFNEDEAHRRVFDGVLSYIGGAGKVFVNAEFALPGTTNTQHEHHFMPENAFPFSAARLKDPLTGKEDAILRGNPFDPLLIEINSSTEYWQKGASLLGTDPLGNADVVLPMNARIFLVAGTHHYGVVSATPGPCANARNPHDAAPALRALLVALDEWIGGRPAPESRLPRLSDGSLVDPEKLEFPAIPGFALLRTVNTIGLPTDWVHPKGDPEKLYRPLVSRVDKDGNEVAGILLPDLAAPLATFTGWNPYGGPNPREELCDRNGSYAPFALTRRERLEKGDPRLSLEERYPSHEAFVAGIRRAADALVKDRLLLPEDAAAYVAEAGKKNPLAP